MATVTLAYARLLRIFGDALRSKQAQSLILRIPAARLAMECMARIARRLVPRHSAAWVQIDGGSARGLWLHVNLAHERGLWAGVHEPEVQAFLSEHIRLGMVLYDVGAHIGLFTLLGAARGAQVVAFEPDPESAGRIRQHAEKNGFSQRVTVVESAVWSSSAASIPFRRGEPRSQGGVCAGEHRPVLARGEVIGVQAVTLDAFAAGFNPLPDVIKIDVEGGEAEVLQGARDAIRRHSPTLIIEVHGAEQYELVREFISAAGYEAEWTVPRDGFPRLCIASRT
jgi:FkbM family methyltransferase